MKTRPNELIKDPLFQLNAILWLTQPLPAESRITPIFYKQGFKIYAIAPLLGPPVDVRLVAQKANLSMQEGIRPDVVLTHERDHKFAFVECKASYSALASSTAQTRSLLVIAGPRAAEVLGLASGQVTASLLELVIPEDDRNTSTQTLASVSKQLEDNNISIGLFSVLGLQYNNVDLSQNFLMT